MTANAVAKPTWPTAPAPPRQPADPEDMAESLTGRNGLDLVIEMAHDLRSPLTSILFLTESLQDERHGPVSDPQRHALRIIYCAALGLSTEANDVLELARGGTRLTDAQPAPCSIVETFVSVRDMILPLAVEKGLDVRLVPPVPDRRMGHPRALSRVLLNLATNAAKFTDSGFVEIAARSLSPESIEFSVRDSGCGLDPADLAALCQPFPRNSTETHPHFSSAGLGLAICHKLVRAMGGELQVETSRDGTRFLFALEMPPAL